MAPSFGDGDFHTFHCCCLVWGRSCPTLYSQHGYDTVAYLQKNHHSLERERKISQSLLYWPSTSQAISKMRCLYPKAHLLLKCPHFKLICVRHNNIYPSFVSLFAGINESENIWAAHRIFFSFPFCNFKKCKRRRAHPSVFSLFSLPSASSFGVIHQEEWDWAIKGSAGSIPVEMRQYWIDGII